MKQIYHILAVVLFVTGALLTSCNKVETTPEENPGLTSEAQTIQFTATLAAKGEDSQSKAITPGTDGEDKEILNVAWAAGEEIAVYYQKSDDSYATTTATVGTPNDDGSAPITATLTSPKDGGTVKFVYPATLHNATGDIDEDKLRNNQVGTIADISANFDAATGSSTISTAAGTAVVSDKVTLTNRVCICKFHFSYQNVGGSLTLSNFHGLKICAPGGAYNITTTTKSDIYVAMLPCTDAQFTFIADATTSDGMFAGRGYCMAFPTGVTLAAGKFYRNLPVTLNRQSSTSLKDLSSGHITASNLDIIYQSDTESWYRIITIPDGITVTLAGVNFRSSGASAAIICEGSANIKLLGTNNIAALTVHYPCIQAGGTGTTLTISGSGSLIAVGAANGAGIGSGYEGSCGAITISGGTVTVRGGQNAAGIGSGYEGSCGAITISGGTVMATGGYYSPGIGSGYNGSCGTIDFTGGSVTASKGTSAPYSIGSSLNGTCGTITIGGTNYGSDGISDSPFTWPTP